MKKYILPLLEILFFDEDEIIAGSGGTIAERGVRDRMGSVIGMEHVKVNGGDVSVGNVNNNDTGTRLTTEDQ